MVRVVKVVYIVWVTMLAGTALYAQRSVPGSVKPVSYVNPYADLFTHGTSRTSAIGDTLALSNIADTASLVLYTIGKNADSGYVTGTDAWNDIGFAEQYSINGNDSTVSILGVFAQFGGAVANNSTQSVTFNIWSAGPAQAINDTYYYSSFPDNALDSLPVAVTHLGIAAAADTMKLFLFPYAAQSFNSFFAGYSINYNFNTLLQDSTVFGLACTRDSAVGNDSRVVYDTFVFDNIDTVLLDTTIVTDTTENVVLNVRNATLGADGTWYDNLTQNDSLRNHLAIFPVVVIQDPTGVTSVTRDNLTFFGNYPNPANNSTNIKCSLATAASLQITLLDMSGRVIQSFSENQLTAGQHIISLNTADLAAGNYLYLLRTSLGDGVAGKLTVQH